MLQTHVTRIAYRRHASHEKLQRRHDSLQFCLYQKRQSQVEETIEFFSAECDEMLKHYSDTHFR